METLFNLFGFIFNALWMIFIIYLIVKAWNGFWHWLFPDE